MQLLHLSAHLYVLTKEYYRKTRKAKSLREDVEKYTHKFHSATSVGDKQKFHHKATKYAHKYKEAAEERHKLMVKMHSFCAGFARGLQQEARGK